MVVLPGLAGSGGDLAGRSYQFGFEELRVIFVRFVGGGNDLFEEERVSIIP